MLVRLVVTVAVLAIAVTLAGGALAANQTVTARTGPNRFDSADVTINQGEKVTWTNGGGSHNVKFDDGSFEMPSNADNSSWTVERTFDTPGDFRYYCEMHGGPGGAGMSGIVHVVAPPGGSPPPPEGSPPATDPPGPPGAGGPAPSLPLLTVTLKLSDATPLVGKRVRLFGVVTPARDGRKLQIQKRARSGAYHTIATTRLTDAGTDRSQFSLRLRFSGDGVLRARVLGDAQRATGVSRAKRVDVHRPA